MRYDVIVVGTGGWGGAACWRLAAAGHRVLGIDRGHPPHSLGSSHGGTRVMHQVGHEGPEYQRIMTLSHQRWYELESATGTTLVVGLGGLFVGPPDWVSVRKAVDHCRALGAPYQILSEGDIRRRYPSFVVRPGELGVFEPGTKALLVDHCVAAQLVAARASGAELLAGIQVNGWEASPSGVTVTAASDHRWEADTLVLAAGPWNPGLLAGRYPLAVDRQVVGWFSIPPGASLARTGPAPIFIFDAAGLFYGIPEPNGAEVKCSFYETGHSVDPDGTFRTVTDQDIANLREAIRERIPALDGPPTRSGVCVSTNTPDLEYLIGRHPDHSNVIIASGDSGRGFQVCPAVGDLIAAMVAGQEPAELTRFSPARFVA